MTVNKLYTVRHFGDRQKCHLSNLAGNSVEYEKILSRLMNYELHFKLIQGSLNVFAMTTFRL